MEPRGAQQAPKKKKVLVPKVVNGVEEMVEIEVDDVAGPQWGPREAMRLLNHDLRRVDGPEKVTGRARYTHDMRLPGMVYARLLHSAYPCAKVTLDFTAALAVPGVVAARGVQQHSEWETRWLGQPIAVVAAKSVEALEDGLRAIAAKYEPTGWAVTAAQASAPGAASVTKSGNLGRESTRGEAASFQTLHDGAAARYEAQFEIPVQHHASLETHGVVVDFRGGDTATVYASTQGTFTVVEDAQEALKLAPGKVTAVVEHMGGGFGSKFGLGVEGQTACELARELGAPVHLMLSREGEFLAGGNRSGTQVRVRAAAKPDGTLIALSSEVLRMGGLGSGSFAGLPYVYRVEDKAGVHSVTRSLYMHTDSSRAMRAPGHPQASFPMEAAIDELAYRLGIDPVEMRLKNLGDEVHRRQLRRAADRIGWTAHPHKTRPQERPDADGTVTGIGFGVSVWGGGGGPECEVKVSIAADGSLSATVGSQDLGNGTRTYVAAIAAEEFGLPLDAATARIGNSNFGRANASGGSTTTASLAPAVKDAAYKASTAFLAHLAGALNVAQERLSFRGGALFEGDTRRMDWKQACATLGSKGVSGDGRWVAALAGNGVHGAQAAKVKVDLATGAVRVISMVGVQDCGLPLNRKAVESQLNGGMIQAMSYALGEERLIDGDLGLMLNANLTDYKLAGSLECPELIPLIDDEDTRGVIGMAEPAIVPGHSAIANAIYNACGVRLTSMPFTPDKVLDGLAALRANGGGK